MDGSSSRPDQPAAADDPGAAAVVEDDEGHAAGPRSTPDLRVAGGDGADRELDLAVARPIASTSPSSSTFTRRRTTCRRRAQQACVAGRRRGRERHRGRKRGQLADVRHEHRRRARRSGARPADEGAEAGAEVVVGEHRWCPSGGRSGEPARVEFVLCASSSHALQVALGRAETGVHSPSDVDRRTHAVHQRLPARSPAGLLRERILVLDGAMGTMIQRYRSQEADFRGDALRRPPAGPARQQRPAVPHPAGRHPRRSTAPTSRPARTSSAPNSFTATPDRPGRLRAVGRRGRDERGGRAARARGGGRRRGRRRRGRASSAGSLGPTNRTGSHLAGRQRPRRAQRALRRARRRLPRGRRGPRRAAAPTCCWSRPSSTRSTRRPRSSRIEEAFEALGCRLPVVICGTIIDASGRTLSRPDAGGVLDEHPARATRCSWGSTARSGAKQLREHVEELAASPTCRSPPTPTPACPTSSAATTRRRPRPATALGEWARAGLRQRRRLVLRHARPSTRRRSRRPSRGVAAARRPRAGAHDPPGRPRAARHPDARRRVRQHRRADQRHRLARSSRA